jgi:acyl-[acyl carrier protein]--UDP-N-acetylglucosamine O-acyltransferase
MQVKLIKAVNIINGPIIPKGEVCTVRIFATVPFQFNPPFQIINGRYSGHMIPQGSCIEFSNERTYTEEEVKKIEKVYREIIEKEQQAKEKAVQLAANASKKLVEKNKEIEKLEFYVSALSIGLSASSEAIKVLRNTEPYK